MPRKKKPPCCEERRRREGKSTRPPRLAGIPFEPRVSPWHRLSLAAGPCVNRVLVCRVAERASTDKRQWRRKCAHIFLVDGLLRSIQTMRKPNCFACRPSLAKNVDLWQSARASRGRRGLHGTPLADWRRVSCLITASQPRKLRYGTSPSHPASLLSSPEIDIFSHFLLSTQYFGFAGRF